MVISFYGQNCFRIQSGGVNILVDGNAVNPNFQYNRKCIYQIKP